MSRVVAGELSCECKCRQSPSDPAVCFASAAAACLLPAHLIHLCRKLDSCRAPDLPCTLVYLACCNVCAACSCAMHAKEPCVASTVHSILRVAQNRGWRLFVTNTGLTYCIFLYCNIFAAYLALYVRPRKLLKPAHLTSCLTSDCTMP